MTYIPPKDEMLHLTLMGGQARVLLCRTTVLSQEMARIHHPSDTACAALSRLMSGTLMLSVMMKGENDSVTVTVAGDGPIGKMTAVAKGGEIKATAEHPQEEVPRRADGHLDVGTLVGRHGRLSVVKDLGLKEPYIGQVNLISGELGEDFAEYFTASEQTPSLVALGARVNDGLPLSTGGILVQAMPDCGEDLLNQLELRSMLFADISRELAEHDLTELAMAWFDGLEPQVVEKQPLFWRCDCSRERMERALLALGKAELTDILNEDGFATLTCHFCRTARVFNEDDLKRLIENA
ncbi:MAG: Hsp33 family molecular chaperone HslO [Clostridia bacterium]|nr:Hsp33 family molecular chaperone HslO [Clostridia bacterium]